MSRGPDLVALSEALRAVLPAEALSFDAGYEYAVDGLKPLVVAAPRTPEEVAAVLRAAGDAGAAVVPRGAGTQMGLGTPPERYDVALDLTNLERIFEHEAADLTVTVDAGHAWDSMQAKLGERGQWVPLDPALEAGGHPRTPAEGPYGAPSATVGGVLATNAWGPARIRYGTARDLVIGMTVALASGEIVKSGGRVVKNVAGYDMAKLHIGALGTLGVILQASFKVSPLAESKVYIGADGSLEAASKLAQDVLAARLPLIALELVKGAATPGWRLLARLAGGAAAVERAVSEFASLAAAGGLQVFQPGEVVYAGGSAAGVRLTVPAVQTRPMAEALANQGASVVAYPGVGAMLGSWAQEPEARVVTALRTAAVAAGGALVLMKGSPELKREAGIWGEPRGDFELMQRLKQEFDPGRVLNRGRYLGGI